MTLHLQQLVSFFGSTTSTPTSTCVLNKPQHASFSLQLSSADMKGIVEQWFPLHRNSPCAVENGPEQ